MIPPHFHKDYRISEVDIIRDGQILSTAPTYPAPEGTEVTYKSGSVVRRYKMVDGEWRYTTLETVLLGSATYDPANLVAGAQATTTITVTGAAIGDIVLATFSLNLQGITLTGYVSAANTVTVVFQNGTAGAINLASGTIQVRVIPQAQI